MIVFPSSIGGLNYSPASYDPTHELHLQRGRRDGRRPDPEEADADRRSGASSSSATSSSGSRTATSATTSRTGRTTARSARSTSSTGQRVWKFKTPEPERGGVTTTASGLGFAGGGDGVAARVRPPKRAASSGRFQTGRPIAAGPTIFTAGGKQYVAITVGGTPTSSNGGTASQLQVFALRAPASRLAVPPRRPSAAPATTASGRSDAAGTAAARAARASGGHERAGAHRHHRAAPFPSRLWRASSSNQAVVSGRVLLRRPTGLGRARRGRPLRPAAARRTRAAASSTASTATLARRHPVRVVGDDERARRRPAAHRRRAGVAAHGGGRDQRRLPARRPARRRRSRTGTVGVTGRAVRADGVAGAAGRAAHLPALGDDHRRGRQARAGRHGRHPHARPELLDVLGADERRAAATSRSSPPPTRSAPTRCR